MDEKSIHFGACWRRVLRDRWFSTFLFVGRLITDQLLVGNKRCSVDGTGNLEFLFKYKNFIKVAVFSSRQTEINWSLSENGWCRLQESWVCRLIVFKFCSGIFFWISSVHGPAMDVTLFGEVLFRSFLCACLCGLVHFCEGFLSFVCLRFFFHPGSVLFTLVCEWIWGGGVGRPVLKETGWGFHFHVSGRF